MTNRITAAMSKTVASMGFLLKWAALVSLAFWGAVALVVLMMLLGFNVVST